MKRKILIPLFLLIAFIGFSQNFKDKKEKIKALKIAYITEKLELTPDEAQKFWPIYNAFDDQEFDIRHNKMRTLIHKIGDGGFESLSEKEAATLLNQMESYEDQLYTLRKKYFKELQSVLSAKKIILLKKSEEEFNRKLLHQFRENRDKRD
ncbi:sensor of ECF-type sigma factor [Flavobacterium sp. NRK F10]|uniref:sensor of ECF-type sigma factor n=1 Tax=Flavobacterium sp. NRK F10 TaxID=2954931 RepID=UPI002090431E|nr:sensor of ECF-type sigma factor [Flavobacterium sp. NRK F10]MCO6176094.1 sensor of ECF-type sigma factor [Flavobacterium sp. NRK F10]